MPSYRGELRLPNKHAIAATHQAADSNAALPRRGRGAVRGEAWRGDDVASALARGHGLLGSGGGGIGDGISADCVLRKRCCSAGSCCSRRAPTAGSGVVPRRPRRRRRARLSEAGRAVLKSMLSDARTGRVRLLWRVTKLLSSPSGRLFAQTACAPQKRACIDILAPAKSTPA